MERKEGRKKERSTSGPGQRRKESRPTGSSTLEKLEAIFIGCPTAPRPSVKASKGKRQRGILLGALSHEMRTEGTSKKGRPQRPRSPFFPVGKRNY